MLERFERKVRRGEGKEREGLGGAAPHSASASASAPAPAVGPISFLRLLLPGSKANPGKERKEGMI